MLILLILISVYCVFGPVMAENLAPDRSQQVLDLLAVECQNISDYASMSSYGDTSGFGAVKEHLDVTISNISILLNGYDDRSLSALRNLGAGLSPDAGSAMEAVQTCTNIRSEIYRKITSDPELNRDDHNITNFDECARAGYHVSGNTCFIGGSPVFDQKGNLIGYYYADCYDDQGYHMGSCWDCFYGADNEGCVKKP